MTDYETFDVNIVGRRIPDYSREVDQNGQTYQQELPGFVEIGVEIEGAFFPLQTIKGGHVDRQIELAAARQDRADIGYTAQSSPRITGPTTTGGTSAPLPADQQIPASPVEQPAAQPGQGQPASDTPPQG